MTHKRLIVILLFFFVMAFAVTHLQAQKVRSQRRIANLNRRLVQLRHEHKQSQLRLAGLCSPAELLERTSGMALGTVAPYPFAPAEVGDAQYLAVSR